MASMRTEFGKALAKLRIERGMLLMEMAKVLVVSPAFLSAVEYGKKNIPKALVDTLAEKLSLSPDQTAGLRKAQERSRQRLRIELRGNPSAEHGEVGAVLARKFPDMTVEKLEKLRKLLEEED